VSNYRVGVIGLSGIATAPAPGGPAFFAGIHPHSHVASYANHPRTEVVAVCDLIPEFIDRFDSQWGDRWPNVGRYTDYHEMLEKEQLDIISVATPDHVHAEVVLAAIPSGIKGIYCEKPMATFLSDADEMIAMAEEHGVAMVINHTRRWFATYQHVKEILDSGQLGRVSHIHVVCGGPRAMLFRNGTHLIDAAIMFADSDPVWVVGQLDPGHEQYGPYYAGEGGRDPALDPGGSGLIRFENGVIASVFCSKSIYSQTFVWEVIVYCEGGSIQITEPGGIELMTMTGDGVSGRSRTPIETPLYQWTDGTAAVDDLIGLIEGRSTDSQSSPREGRKSLGVLFAMLQSQHQGNIPILAPFADTPLDQAR
jgi:predicted dehydrogenase